MFLANSLNGKMAAPNMTRNGITTIQVSASYPDSYEIGGQVAYRCGETPHHSPIVDRS